MISIIGTSSLYISLLLSLACCTLLFFKAYLERVGKYVKFAIDLNFIINSFSLALLIYAFAVSDFSIALVMNHSHTNKPILYKLCAIWANHQGSLLFWLWLLNLLNIIFYYYSQFSLSERTKIMCMQALISATFMLLILFTANPFTASQGIILTGSGLNPLLQDPGLAIHPPSLYIGMVGFSLPYSAVVICSAAEQNNKWFYNLKFWIVLPWIFLTLGIGFGSWWAYHELGWGGYWFWDPIENAALIPWLLATALIHNVKLTATKGRGRLATIILAVFCFLSTILCAFLTRSGLVSSVHSFAYDLKNTYSILAIFTFFCLFSGALIYLSRKNNQDHHPHYSLINKESAIILNSILCCVFALAILCGILYPSLYQLFNGQSVNISASYYQSALSIIIIPTIILAATFAFFRWGSDKIWGHVIPWIWLSIVSILLTFATILIHPITSHFLIFILLITYFLALNLVVHFIKNILIGSFSFYYVMPMFISHFGLAVLITAITLNQAWQEERVVRMKPGANIAFHDYSIKLENIEYLQQDNFYIRQANFDISLNDKLITKMHPQTRFYSVENLYTSEVSLYHDWLSDLYLTIGEILPGGEIIVNLQYQSLINLIWIGVGLISLGGIMSLLRRGPLLRKK